APALVRPDLQGRPRGGGGRTRGQSARPLSSPARGGPHRRPGMEGGGMTGPVRHIFDARLRGIRVVEIIGVLCLIGMVLSVYVAKAGAAREAAVIGDLETRIAAERHRLRLLRAETARL